jgi:DinB superfamily
MDPPFATNALRGMSDPRYPIGEFRFGDLLTRAERDAAIHEIEMTPAKLRVAVQGLTDVQLDTPYRDGGWTVRQVVHHLPDSHINSYMRLKLALTEDAPTIRTYLEARWAELVDSRGPVELSLRLLDALHARWVHLLQRLSDDQWGRPLLHPDLGRMRVDALAAYYAWHGNHHVAHVTSLRDRRGW